MTGGNVARRGEFRGGGAGDRAAANGKHSLPAAGCRSEIFTSKKRESRQRRDSQSEEVELHYLRRCRLRSGVFRRFTLMLFQTALPHSVAQRVLPLHFGNLRAAHQVWSGTNTPSTVDPFFRRHKRIMSDNLAVHTMQDEVADRHKGTSSVDVLSTTIITGKFRMGGNQEPTTTAGRISEIQAFSS